MKKKVNKVMNQVHIGLEERHFDEYELRDLIKGSDTYYECDSNCICSLEKNNCTGCYNDYKLIEDQNSCTSYTQKEGYYPRDSVFKKCDKSCKKCTEEGPDKCSGCAAPYYFIELDNDYTAYIMKYSNFDKNTAKHFAEASKNDLGIIQHRLHLYNLSDGEYKRFNDYSGDIYVWVKNFIQKKRLPKIEESPISIMALLSNNCQNLLSVKLNQTQNINPYALKHLKELVSFRTEDELKQIIGDCFYLDCQVKKGLIDVNDTLKILKVKYY